MGDIADFEKYLLRARKKNRDKILPRTIETYKYFVKAYINEFETLEGQELVDRMNQEITKRPSIVITSAFRRYLLFRGYDEEIARRVKPPTDLPPSALKSKRVLQSKVLSRGELKRLYREADEEMRLKMSFLYDTACRRDEMLGVKMSDIKYVDNNRIRAEVPILGKGAKGRTVYLTETTVKLLQSLRSDYRDDEYVFRYYKDPARMVEYKQQGFKAWYDIQKYCNKTLDRHITPHCFRHTKLTHMADKGADILGISRYAGHSDISVCQIYIEISTFLGERTFQNYAEAIA